MEYTSPEPHGHGSIAVPPKPDADDVDGLLLVFLFFLLDVPFLANNDNNVFLDVGCGCNIDVGGLDEETEKALVIGKGELLLLFHIGSTINSNSIMNEICIMIVTIIGGEVI